MQFIDSYLMAAFTFVGAVVCFLLVLKLLSVTCAKRGDFRMKLPLQIKDSDFLPAVAGAIDRSVQHGGTVEIINRGEFFLKMLLEDISQAQSTITITAYMWQPGEMSNAVVQALMERVKAGVSIYLLLDSQGSFWMNAKQLHRLKEAGAAISYFRPFCLGNMTGYNRRSHRRAFVIDGKIGYTGGIAIADTWLEGKNKPDYWRDMTFRTTGPPVAAIQSFFAELWVAATGQFLAGDKYYDPTTRQFSMSGLTFLSVASSPTAQTQPLDKLMWMTVHAAQKKLLIASPFFTPYKHVRKEIIRRAKAGVDVRLLLPSRLDVWFVRRAAVAHYGELLAAGVKIFEYLPTLFHSKFMVADGLWSIIGSANVDIRSVRLNEEGVLGIHDRTFASQLEENFIDDLKQSQEISYQVWSKRPLHLRMIDKILVLFEEQF